MSGDVVMHNLKLEVLQQINQFDIVVQINGFVVIDGKFFVTVSVFVLSYEFLMIFFFYVKLDDSIFMCIRCHIHAILHNLALSTINLINERNEI